MTTEPAEPELLTFAEACHLLCVSASTLRRLIARHHIPALTVGGRYRFRAHDLAHWLPPTSVFRGQAENGETDGP